MPAVSAAQKERDLQQTSPGSLPCARCPVRGEVGPALEEFRAW